MSFWRHRKRGTVYESVGIAVLQVSTSPVGNGSRLVVYRGSDGALWAREEGEFADGRFERVRGPDIEDGFIRQDFGDG